MTRRTIVIIVAGVAGVAALIGFLAVFLWISCARRAPRAGAAGAAEAPPAPITQGAPPEVKTQMVAIYQRADKDELLLVGVPAQVVWFNAPVDRARQVVQLVLEGVPGAENVTPPAPPGIRYRDIYITARGVAWVDLDGASLGELDGSDEEMALVGALARSLTGALSEVQAVGILIDGRPHDTLAGHVDLTRTYTGAEWPATGGLPAAPPEGEAAPAPGSEPAPALAPGATPPSGTAPPNAPAPSPPPGTARAPRPSPRSGAGPATAAARSSSPGTAPAPGPSPPSGAAPATAPAPSPSPGTAPAPSPAPGSAPAPSAPPGSRAAPQPAPAEGPLQ